MGQCVARQGAHVLPVLLPAHVGEPRVAFLRAGRVEVASLLRVGEPVGEGLVEHGVAGRAVRPGPRRQVDAQLAEHPGQVAPPVEPGGPGELRFGEGLLGGHDHVEHPACAPEAGFVGEMALEEAAVEPRKPRRQGRQVVEPKQVALDPLQRLLDVEEVALALLAQPGRHRVGRDAGRLDALRQVRALKPEAHVALHVGQVARVLGVELPGTEAPQALEHLRLLARGGHDAEPAGQAPDLRRQDVDEVDRAGVQQGFVQGVDEQVARAALGRGE